MKIVLRVIILMQFFGLSFMCCFVNAGKFVKFTAPSDTIRTYFENYGDKTVIANCFFPPISQIPSEKWWIEYKIVSERRTNKAGDTTYSDILISKDAVEVIVDVKLYHPKKNNPNTKFWYLLQKVESNWKIIDHSHIPDNKYPPYD